MTRITAGSFAAAPGWRAFTPSSWSRSWIALSVLGSIVDSSVITVVLFFFRLTLLERTGRRLPSHRRHRDLLPDTSGLEVLRAGQRRRMGLTQGRWGESTRSWRVLYSLR